MIKEWGFREQILVLTIVAVIGTLLVGFLFLSILGALMLGYLCITDGRCMVFGMLLRMKPYDIVAWIEYAKALYVKKEYADAIQMCKRAIEMGKETSPEGRNRAYQYLDLWRVLIHAYEEIGMVKEAEKILEMALKAGISIDELEGWF